MLLPYIATIDTTVLATTARHVSHRTELSSLTLCSLLLPPKPAAACHSASIQVAPMNNKYVIAEFMHSSPITAAVNHSASIRVATMNNKYVIAAFMHSVPISDHVTIASKYTVPHNSLPFHRI